MGKFWDSGQLIGTVQKNDKGDEIQVRRFPESAIEMVDIRTYYRDDAGNLQPGSGISIPADLVDEVANLLLKSGGE